MKHKAGKGDVMEARERFGQAFIVTREPAKACSPREAAFNHPAPRQQHKATFGFSVFDHLQFDATTQRRLPGVLSGIPLIHIGQLHVLIRNLLHGLRQLLKQRMDCGFCRGRSENQLQCRRGDILEFAKKFRHQLHTPNMLDQKQL